MNMCTYCQAVKKKDGTSELIQYSPVNSYRAATYEVDFSPIIESVEDFHGEYDRILDLEK